jgi:hypothetical protein
MGTAGKETDCVKITEKLACILPLREMPAKVWHTLSYFSLPSVLTYKIL